MSLESELLAQICAEPANQEVPVVYADKLIERGDPRGTFIAQQCELAKLDVLDARYPALLASTRRLGSGARRDLVVGVAEAHEEPKRRSSARCSGRDFFMA